ncbi:bifunctional [glutamate--ammonia ligase]-adenylyl-L-tyrosine phosphorylase/[glutamate--ammonia-ligase] adenylyltransferase [Undibacterium sp. LX40W]|uniref:Bifunctional glutamine synthetase adenylyltransferase/adenylyl-removing enzyme n=1 Tax=Undibacterium nitidum TaxID=2762298 RepID=A0A923HLR1_9BURK|nr:MULTISPECIES: bifunctional [glutamate--ammonia ligase]-adenylyl-L-tyrosine phosphorylase/[glutamate--ammonia-ligase] adenylyltransferase [Undibacterium]MBC3880131.1 bifunctional [glutamate--ammonia ligase]-adenylyl-L-tyrosine phosphorylase/[glutamate--ammonia-ligase] adenylyltransferase [Undibacterium nitidum]MBC3891133.1 bifunctional [glutamate--ammonia ligase]-adenylyl-L-tyrosine phosphorylase/[glutamate--ammonia-ligase] adenylyltransferase [Undibacterium sp. LX40W]
MNANHIQSLEGYQSSRFLNRWLAAKSERLPSLIEQSALSMTKQDFAQILQNEIDSGAILNAAMRRTRNLVMASLIKRDLEGQAELHEVVTTVSEFADFVVQTHLQSLMEEMVTNHGDPIGEESGEKQELIVLGMGKLGGFELNVSSDIDLIFCYNEDGETKASGEQRQLSNHEFFSRLGKKLIAAISEITEDGFSFRVDMALRPNGASGPLVASFGMIEDYFLVQGREWERYAWVKARALTGKPSDINVLDKMIFPFVYRRYLDYGVIDSLRNMHHQIRAEVIRQETRHPDRGINVKLGRGGIREVEFLAQVFQLIRGGREAHLRDRSTRATLLCLAEKGILDGLLVDQLLQAYNFLRNVEHRLQYLDDAQTHIFPAKLDDQTIVARMMGYPSVEALNQVLVPYMQFVAEQFDAIFKEKSDNEEHQLDASTMSDQEAHENIVSHLQSLQFHDMKDVATRIATTWQSTKIQALSESTQQKMAGLINAALLTIAKQKEAQLETISRFLDFLEQIARRTAYLSLLTEFPHALERVVRMMAASDWAAKFLNRHPILLDELLDESVLHQVPDWIEFESELMQALQAHEGDIESQLDTLREYHHALLFRLLAQDLEGRVSVEHLADLLSKLADIMVEAVVQSVWKTIPNRHLERPQFAVIAYGKLGGKELSYASDLDVIFLYDDEDQEAPALYAKLAQRFITWMTTHTSSGILFDIDIALRPDGASGLMVSSLAAFERYQEKSAWLWEHQALTRARFCAGDHSIGEKFEQIRRQVLSQIREPQKLREEVIHMRKRMRDANVNRSKLFDLKHDEGGMIDIEFIVQYLILMHANKYPELTGNLGNIALLKRCGQLGLIDEKLANETANTYRVLRKYQHNIRLQGEEKARVAKEKLADVCMASLQLWSSLFSPEG